MLHLQKEIAKVLDPIDEINADSLDRLKYAAARKLCVWHEHHAGGGSFYVTIGGSLKLRFADHANTSAYHRPPDYNFVKRKPTEQEISEIENRIQYPRLCKKTAFAKHVGLTVPKLKRLLTPEAYEEVCENEYYYNTYTEFIVVATAFSRLELAGINTRFPVSQEIYSLEDYCGY